MAVTPGYVGSAAITWSASTAATVTGQSIGTAAWDRIVVVGVTVEETATIDSCTIGGVTANVGISVRNTTGTPDNAAAIFWLPVATGTTADVVVTLSASSSQTGRISVWAMTGANPGRITDSDSGQGAGTTQTITALTTPTSGASFLVFNNATGTTAVTWTNATERDDTNVGNYRHSAADTTTAGTPTITADGATANQILAGIAFEDATQLYGWDHTPQNEGAVWTSARAVAIASMAAGVVLVEMPPITPPPAFNSFDVTTAFVARRSINYQDMFHVQRPIDPAPQQTTVTTTTDQFAPRTLFYQSLAQPVVAPAADNTGTVDTWLVRWPQAPRELPPLSGGIIAPPAAFEFTATPDKWLQPFRGAQRTFLPLAGGALSPPAPPFVAAPTLEWLQPWSGPPRELQRVADGSPFTPKEAVIDNTVERGWEQPLSHAAPPTRLNVTDVTYAAVAPQVVTLTTTLEWLQPFRGPPFSRPIHTQPVGVPGHPYAAVGNLTTTLEWMQPWQGPQRLWPLGKPYQPFVPAEATRDNTQTPDKWLQAFRGPPRYQPVKSEWIPFIPKEAVLENTQTPDKWLLGFRAAFPTKPVHTQPVFIAQPAAAPSLGWLQAWQGPPRYRPAKTQVTYQVQQPAAVSNLTTTLEWMPSWQGPPRFWPSKTQALYQVRVVPFVSNLTATMEWMPLWKAAVPHAPRSRTQLPWNFVPPAAGQYAVASVEVNRVSARPSLFYQSVTRPVKEPPYVSNEQTIDKWQQPLSRAPKATARLLLPGQAFLSIQGTVIAPSAQALAQVITERVTSRTLFYQAVGAPCYEPPPGAVCIPAFDDGAFQTDAFQTCVDVNQYTQSVDATVTLSVDIHICAWYAQAEQVDSGIIQSEQSDPFVEQAESTDEYEEQEECGR